MTRARLVGARLALFTLLALPAAGACGGSSSKSSVPPAPTTTTTTTVAAGRTLTTGLGGDAHRCTRDKIATVETAIDAYRAQHNDPKATPSLAVLVQTHLLAASPDGVTLDYSDGQPSINAAC